MKHKTAELSGALLDAAVTRALIASDVEVTTQGFPWPYSTDWRYGGPVIERERIGLETWADSDVWTATVYNSTKCAGHPQATGPTPLIAAMRALVAARLGDEVDLP